MLVQYHSNHVRGESPAFTFIGDNMFIDIIKFTFQTVGRTCWAIQDLNRLCVEKKAPLSIRFRAIWINRNNYRKFIFGNHRTFNSVRNGASVIYFTKGDM